MNYKFIELNEQSQGDYRFYFTRIKNSDWDNFYESVELLDWGYYPKAYGILKKLVTKYPEFLDAQYHISSIEEVELENYFTALKIIIFAVKLGLNAIPPSFKFNRDIIDWHHLENRGFLRSYSKLGFEYYLLGLYEQSKIINEKIISFNPNDNIGCREVLISIYLELNDPDKVITLCNKYEDDTTEGVLYGRAIALLMKKQKDLAIKYLKNAIYYAPQVAELLINKPIFNYNENNRKYLFNRLTDPAQYYVYRDYKFWKKTRNSIKLLKELINR